MFVLLVFPPQRVANDAVDAFLKYVLQMVRFLFTVTEDKDL